MKKLLVVLLSMLMVVSMVGCSKETVEEDNSPLAATLEIDGSTYNEVSATLYEANLGEYDDLYSKAKEATTNSERWALMALAEAKLMESAVYVPTSSNCFLYNLSIAFLYETLSSPVPARFAIF